MQRAPFGFSGALCLGVTEVSLSKTELPGLKLLLLGLTFAILAAHF